MIYTLLYTKDYKYIIIGSFSLLTFFYTYRNVKLLTFEILNNTNLALQNAKVKVKIQDYIYFD